MSGIPREIKFRGLTKEGRWVYGSLELFTNCDPQTASINKFCDWGLNARHWVDIKTVGQFTGLTDDYGNDIYEGDIIKSNDGDKDWLHKVKITVFGVLFDDYSLTNTSFKNKLVVGTIHDIKE